MAEAESWYIKERHNPQLLSPYYRALGRLNRKEAEEMTATLYGTNVLLKFDNEEEYNKKIAELKLDPPYAD